MDELDLKALVLNGTKGFLASSLLMPGCISFGQTPELARHHLALSVQAYVDAVNEQSKRALRRYIDSGGSRPARLPRLSLAVQG